MSHILCPRFESQNQPQNVVSVGSKFSPGSLDSPTLLFQKLLYVIKKMTFTKTSYARSSFLLSVHKFMKIKLNTYTVRFFNIDLLTMKFIAKCKSANFHHCVVPENIHTPPPTEDHWKFRGGGGFKGSAFQGVRGVHGKLFFKG